MRKNKRTITIYNYDNILPLFDKKTCKQDELIDFIHKIRKAFARVFNIRR
jgi:hypothetical protein